jgi:hypothetical protein
MPLEHIREHIWAEITAVAAVPSGGALRRERAAVLLGMSQAEIDTILFTLADLVPEKFAEALDLACDCVPLPHEEHVPITYPAMVKGEGDEWISRELFEFQACFSRTVQGGVDLAAEIDAAGGRQALAKAWGVPVRSVRSRVRAILKAHPDDPALDPLAEYALLWGLQV